MQKEMLLYKETYSEFAKINGTTISLYNERPSVWLGETLLEQVYIDKFDNRIEIRALKWNMEMCFERQYVEDMKEQPMISSWKYGYKNIIDLFKGIRKPYVQYKYWLNRKTEFSVAMNQFKIIF